MRRTAPRWAAFAVLAGAVAACDLNGDSGLYDGTFTYVCAQESGDPACFTSPVVDDKESPESLLGGVPGRVAIGAAFKVTFATQDHTVAAEDGVPVPVVAASSRLAARGSDGSFVGSVPGVLALLAMDAAGVVHDFVDVHFRRVDKLQLHTRASSRGDAVTATASTLQIAVGRPADLQPIPFDATGASLAGALPYAWTVDDPSIATISGTPDRPAITGNRAGATTVHLSGGGATLDVAVTVAPSAATNDAGAGDAGDGGTSGDAADGGASSDGGANGDGGASSDGGADGGAPGDAGGDAADAGTTDGGSDA